MPEGTVVGDTAGWGVQGEGEGLVAGAPSRAQPRRVVPHACLALGLRPQQKYVVGGDEGRPMPADQGSGGKGQQACQNRSGTVGLFSCSRVGIHCRWIPIVCSAAPRMV